MGIGENAIEIRYAQAFSLDFDRVETSLAGFVASAFEKCGYIPEGVR